MSILDRLMMDIARSFPAPKLIEISPSDFIEVEQELRKRLAWEGREPSWDKKTGGLLVRGVPVIPSSRS